MSLQILLSPDLAYKLHERRAKCFTGIDSHSHQPPPRLHHHHHVLGLGRHTAAGSSYQEALTSLADAKLDAEKKEKLEQGLRNSLNQVLVTTTVINQKDYDWD